MKKWILLVLGVVLAIGVYFRMHSQPPEPVLTAPEIRLADRLGKIVSTRDFKGKLLIVHFWAAWCPPCLDELPALVKLAESMKDLPIHFYLVSTDAAWPDAMKVAGDLSKADNVTLVLDPSSKSAETYGTYQLPETYMMSPQGRIRMKWVGPQKWGSDEAKNAFLREIKKD